jgi:hypothetical protein
MARYNDEKIVNEFNRRVGGKARRGRPQSPRKKFQTGEDVKKGAAGTHAQIASGTKKLPADLKRAYRTQFGPESTGGGRNIVNSFTDTVNNIFDDIERETFQKANERKLLEKQYESGEAELPDFLKGDEGGFWNTFSKSPVGRALDVVSRPSYALFEGMQNVLEEGYKPDASGNPSGEGISGFLNAFPDFASGALEGITGREKTGFGEVWQTYVDDSETLPAERYRKLEQDHPAVASWGSRGIGLAGEIGLDPLNWVSAGTAGILRGSGEQVTEMAARNAAEEVAVKATNDFVDRITEGLSATEIASLPSRQAIVHNAVAAAREATENSTLELTGGATRGRVSLTGPHHAPAVANRVAESVRKTRLSGFEWRLENFIKGYESQNPLSAGVLSHYRHSNPEFNKFLDALDAEYKVSQGQSLSAILADVHAGRTSYKAMIRSAADNVRHTIDDEIIRVRDDTFMGAENLTYNTVGVRLGPRKNSVTIPIKTIGKVYTKARGSRPASIMDNIGDAVSYEKAFPGRLSLLVQRARSVGTKEFDEFRTELRKISRGFTGEEAAMIQRAIEKGAPLPTRELEDAKTFIQGAYKKMFDNEVAAGARNSNNEVGHRWADNYTYVYNRKGSKADRTKFKDRRKLGVHKTGEATGYTTDAAKAARLRPVENAFQALMYRKLKSERELVRAYFLKDLVNNYGIYGPDMPDSVMKSRQIAKVNAQRLNATDRALTEGHKGNFYLPEAHMDLYNKYLELSGLNSENMWQIFRQLNKITGMYKTSVTVPFPGFHVRNMIGDFFMGLLDGVKTREYEEVMRKWILNTNKKPTNYTIAPGWSMTHGELLAHYETHAAGSFYNTDLPTSGIASKAQHIPKAIASGARELSTWREDFGRVTHYLHALREEAQNRAKNGKITSTTLRDKATDSAVYRVNHYKFDYNALTAVERKLKMAFPFYTYTRKAVPTLVESLALSPKFLGIAGRPFLQTGGAEDVFNEIYIPEWMQDAGTVMITDEEEPLAATADVLPFGAANSLDFNNFGDFSASLLAQANPVPMTMIEQAANHTMFSGSATPPLPQYLLEKLSLPIQAGRAVEQTNEGVPIWEQMLNSRLGLGVSTRRISEEQQDFRYRQLEDQAVQDPFREFNFSQERYSVYVSSRADGTDYRVKDKNTGEVVFRTTDLESMREWMRNHQ